MSFEDFIKQIKAYESDTFSASGSELTDDEAKKVAEQLLDWLVESRLDGVLITEALDEVRS